MSSSGIAPGMILLDMQAVFPSIGCGWLRWVLHRMGDPDLLTRASFAMHGVIC